MGLNRYKYLVRTYATLFYLGADRVPGAARHTGSCARAASLSPGSVTAGSWHSVAGYLAVLPIAHVGYLRAATIASLVAFTLLFATIGNRGTKYHKSYLLTFHSSNCRLNSNFALVVVSTGI